jgi:hypothetical protein
VRPSSHTFPPLSWTKQESRHENDQMSRTDAAAHASARDAIFRLVGRKGATALFQAVVKMVLVRLDPPGYHHSGPGLTALYGGGSENGFLHLATRHHSLPLLTQLMLSAFLSQSSCGGEFGGPLRVSWKPRSSGFADRTRKLRFNPGFGTAGCVCCSSKSVEWDALVSDSQRRRRNIIEAFRVKNGNKRFATITTDDIRRMMGLIENVYERWHWLKVIRALFKAGVPSMRLDDPTIGISVKIPRTKGHVPWSDDEIQQYRNYWPLGTQQRLVLEFALEALSRRCEVVRLGPQHVKDGRIRIERAKGSADVDIRLTPELAAAIEATDGLRHDRYR